LVDLYFARGEQRLEDPRFATLKVEFDMASAILRRVDAALYAAKHAGRNCVRTDASSNVDTTIDWIEMRGA
jgi:hypothetical protein